MGFPSGLPGPTPSKPRLPSNPFGGGINHPKKWTDPVTGQKYKLRGNVRKQVELPGYNMNAKAVNAMRAGNMAEAQRLMNAAVGAHRGEKGVPKNPYLK